MNHLITAPVKRPSNAPREPLFEFHEVVERIGKTAQETRWLMSRNNILPVFEGKPRKYRMSDFQRALQAEGDLTKVGGWPPAEGAPFKAWVQALTREVKTLPVGGRISIPDKNSSNLVHHVRLLCQGMCLATRIDKDDPTKRWVYRLE